MLPCGPQGASADGRDRNVARCADGIERITVMYEDHRQIARVDHGMTARLQRFPRSHPAATFGGAHTRADRPGRGTGGCIA